VETIWSSDAVSVPPSHVTDEPSTAGGSLDPLMSLASNGVDGLGQDVRFSIGWPACMSSAEGVPNPGTSLPGSLIGVLP